MAKDGGYARRNEAQAQKDLRDIAEMRLRRCTVAEITEYINSTRPYTLSSKTVYRDITKAIQEWKNDRSKLISEHRDQELATINNIEREAWISYRKSLADRVTTTGITEMKGNKNDGERKEPKKLTIKTEKQHGDAFLLKIINDCSFARRQLLGLDSPEKIQVMEVPTIIDDIQ